MNIHLPAVVRHSKVQGFDRCGLPSTCYKALPHRLMVQIMKDDATKPHFRS